MCTKIFIFTLTSHNAKRIVKKHNDESTMRWIGATTFEKNQMIMVDGNAEIVLEIAANLEIENVELVNEMSYIR